MKKILITGAGSYVDEIMLAGNFGQYDPRIRDAHSGSMVKLHMKYKH